MKGPVSYVADDLVGVCVRCNELRDAELVTTLETLRELMLYDLAKGRPQ